MGVPGDYDTQTLWNPMESYGFHDIMTFKSNHIQKLNGSEAVYLGGKRGKTLQGLSDLVVWGGVD